MKITKEHLHCIYADNNKSNRDKLSTLCDNFGVKSINDEGFKFIEIYSCDGGFSDDFELLDTDNPESTSRFVSSDDIDEMLRAAALEEKKPRTKVEYVKWNFECAWHAIKAFEDGEKLYTKRSHKDFILIDSAQDVLRFLYDLHERIETPITEREAFVDSVSELCDEMDINMGKIDWIAKTLFDSGKFKLVN